MDDHRTHGHCCVGVAIYDALATVHRGTGAQGRKQRGTRGNWMIDLLCHSIKHYWLHILDKVLTHISFIDIFMSII